MTFPTLRAQLDADLATWPEGSFYDEARAALERGHFRLLSTDGVSLYLARFWLTTPRPSEDGRGSLESGDSTLLHRIYQPDSCEALHDHPWAFSSEILAGGYREVVRGTRRDDENVLTVGDRIRHGIFDFHRIAAVEPGTWTRVITGQRLKEWGFWVPWHKAQGPRGRGGASPSIESDAARPRSGPATSPQCELTKTEKERP